MRLLVDSLIALMLVGILGAALHVHYQHRRERSMVFAVQSALGELHEQARLHGAVANEDATSAGFPRRIDPRWFAEELPVNVLIDRQHLWIDQAPAGDYSEHPPDPVLTDREQAGFWYNPNLGVFRARVAPRLSDTDALRIYNRVNNSRLESLPDPEERTLLARRPIPLPVVAPDHRTTQVAAHASTNTAPQLRAEISTGRGGEGEPRASTGHEMDPVLAQAIAEARRALDAADAEAAGAAPARRTGDAPSPSAGSARGDAPVHPSLSNTVPAAAGPVNASPKLRSPRSRASDASTPSD